MDDVRVSMIAAVAENGVIGRENDMPWYIPSDLQFFKRTTLGKPLIMGRKQFESVGRPLPKRVNIVVSRQPGYQPDGVIVINDFDAAIAHAKSIAVDDGVDEVMIIGGGEIYRRGLVLADRLYITHVELQPEGDVYFPDIDPEIWDVVDTPLVAPSDKDEASYRNAVYARRVAGAH